MKYISENYLLAKLHANGHITQSDIKNVTAEDYHEVNTGYWIEHIQQRSFVILLLRV